LSPDKLIIALSFIEDGAGVWQFWKKWINLSYYYDLYTIGAIHWK